MEPVIRAHPLRGQGPPVTAGLACTDSAGHSREALLRFFELVEVGLRDLRRRETGRERLKLGAHEEGLPHALARQRPDTYPAVRLELDEPEGCEPPQRLAHGCTADSVLFGELVLTQHLTRLQLARDNRLLDLEGDVVGLGSEPVHLAGTVRRRCVHTRSSLN